MKKFNPEKNFTFMTYFTKSFFKNCKDEFTNYRSKRKINCLNVRITQRLVQKSRFSTLIGEKPHKNTEINFEVLSVQQRKVIKEIFYENKNMAEIGREMGFTRQRIKQIMDKSLEILRNSHDC